MSKAVRHPGTGKFVKKIDAKPAKDKPGKKTPRGAGTGTRHSSVADKK